MAIIKIGDVTGAIYQSERPTHLNPDGSGQSTLTYKCTTESQYAVIPQYLSPHPYLPNLRAWESELNQEPGGIITISTIYKGVLAPNPQELAQYEYSKTLLEAPIETFPRYALPRDSPPLTKFDIDAVELALQNCTGLPPLISTGPDSPPAAPSDICKEYYEKKRRGIDSYYRLGATFKKTYVSNNVPGSSLFNNIGKQFSSLPSPAPSPPSGQSYLMMAANWTRQAGVVTITEEYQLSGEGGWDPQLYPTAGI
jgi:hypothetical protein